jgi:uncharacterized membrane protein
VRLAGGAKKAVLTTHVLASVGWLGAVICFGGLSIVALVSDDPLTVRGAYAVMEQTGWFVMIPLSFASLISGIVQGLGSRWGVLRHYWVIFKLGINGVASVVLVMYMQTLAALSDDAAAPGADPLKVASPSPVVHSAGALVLLVVATVLSVYKPRGMTKRGRAAWSRTTEARGSAAAASQ